jgi:hypothetical protein
VFLESSLIQDPYRPGMSWLLIAVLVVVYGAAMVYVIMRMAPGPEPKHLAQDDDAMAVLEQRLHRELKQAS